MAAQAQTLGKNKTRRVEIATDEQIRRRAYEIYLARDGQDGSELDDWLRAEAELAAPRGLATEEE
jgi:hypothetical protein